jgi:hypothetical protein
VAIGNPCHCICFVAIVFNACMVITTMDAFEALFCIHANFVSFKNTQDVFEISEG